METQYYSNIRSVMKFSALCVFCGSCSDLQEADESIKALSHVIPLCAGCIALDASFMDEAVQGRAKPAKFVVENKPKALVWGRGRRGRGTLPRVMKRSNGSLALTLGLAERMMPNGAC